MQSTGTLCISIIILIIVIILIVMVCYNYNQTQNTQTTQPYIQNPGLVAAAIYNRKNNFEAECGDYMNGDSQCCNVQNLLYGPDGNNPCTTKRGKPGTCFNGNCQPFQ